MSPSLLKKILFGKKLEIKDEDKVSLPVIFGIKPVHYCAVLYGAALVLILFLVLIYPGISKPGSLGIFVSEPQGAAVRVDNVTLGYTPCRIFIPQGRRSIEFALPGFETSRQEVEVKGRVFASLFFPSRIHLAGTLALPDPAGAFGLSALEYMYWSGAGEPTEAYQIPMSLSEGAYRTAPAAKDPVIRKQMQGIMDNSLRYAATRASVRDLVRAQFLLDNRGLSPSPLSILASCRNAAARIENSPGSSQWLSTLLSSETAQKIIHSPWFNEGRLPQNSTDSAIDISFRVPVSLNLEGVYFTAVSPGYLEKFGQKEPIPPMLIARLPVSAEAWDAFTKENPDWAAVNRESLIAGGIAGEDYLVPINTPLYPEPAAPGISWYAAKAYCAWLHTKLPSSLEGWELRLPSEAEWEYAVRQTELTSGLVWEWCLDSYAPLDFFPLSEDTIPLLEKIAANSSYVQERVVRGGSWINPPGSTDIESRGSLPPDISSPFAGFRPVIVPKRGQ